MTDINFDGFYEAYARPRDVDSVIQEREEWTRYNRPTTTVRPPRTVPTGTTMENRIVLENQNTVRSTPNTVIDIPKVKPTVGTKTTTIKPINTRPVVSTQTNVVSAPADTSQGESGSGAGSGAGSGGSMVGFGNPNAEIGEAETENPEMIGAGTGVPSKSNGIDILGYKYNYKHGIAVASGLAASVFVAMKLPVSPVAKLGIIALGAIAGGVAGITIFKPQKS